MGGSNTAARGDLASVRGPGDYVEIDLTGPDPIVRWHSQALALDESRPDVLSRVMVRSFDVVAASLLLAATAPILAAVACLVLVSGPGPLLYPSKRIAQNGGFFEALKFRTMHFGAEGALADVLTNNSKLAEEYSAGHKLRNDPRITRVGRFLRLTSLDELPQLVNVLRGEMSLVGPRPKLPSEAVLYGETLNTVLRVRPGLTGLWQTSGRNDLSFDERIMLDLHYATTRSASLDAKIIARTVFQMLSPRSHGAY